MLIRMKQQFNFFIMKMRMNTLSK